jgi:hypothetical protein
MLAIKYEEDEHGELEDGLADDVFEHGFRDDIVISFMGLSFQKFLCGWLCC